MKRLLAFLFLLALALAVSAGQVCTIDPARPAPGAGFYVVGSKLYDPTGEEFRIRGVNRVHPDSWGGAADAKLMGANTIRIAPDFRKTQAANWALVDPYVSAGLVPVVGNWAGTCKSDPAVLTAIVDTWVAQADTWTKYNSTGLINIANEWGPSNSPIWRDSYITAIGRMRAAGYLGTLVVDSGYCGQDAQDIAKYGAAVLAADPLKNILFDVHVYGSWHKPVTASWQQGYDASFAAIKATGLPIIVGELGPGNNIGPSPTMVTPGEIVATAEAMGFGWMAWALDDVNLPNCAANDAWFSMTTKCGRYTGSPDELTAFGKVMLPLFVSTGAALAHVK